MIGSRHKSYQRGKAEGLSISFFFSFACLVLGQRSQETIWGTGYKTQVEDMQGNDLPTVQLFWVMRLGICKFPKGKAKGIKIITLRVGS